jgi:hypothetical protein
MDFVLSKELLGTHSHLRVKTEPREFRWTDVETQPSFNGSNGDLDTALRLQRLDRPTVPEAYRSVVSCIGIDPDSPRWSKLLPTGRFREYVSSLLTTADDILSGQTWNYVVNTFRAQQTLLDSLGHASIDVPKLNRLCRSTHGDTSTLDSFEANASGFAERVCYDRFKTATGRLTVASGPRILTLPKTARGIIKSRFPSGKIVFIDYVSLEPRIALAVAGGTPERDIYTQIEQDLNLGLSRDIIKRAVLSILYGAGTKKVSELTGLPKSNAYKLSSSLKELFCVKRIVKKVTDAVVDGCMRNYFGRPIFADKKSPAILYNHYVQSTAADAALLGFASMFSSLEQYSEQCIPLFVIHDCIVLDCAPDFDVSKYRHELCSIPGFKNEFYVEIKHG